MPTKKANRNRASGAPRIPGSDTFPGQSAGKGLPEAQWTACRQLLKGVYGAKEGSRYMAPIFTQLPDREDYADYYEAIPEPECLDNVAERLSSLSFSTAEECFKQLHLVFLNAKHYNEEGSQIWEDAKRLEDQIHVEWRLRASEGVFRHQDPYHFSPRKPARKTKRQRERSDDVRGSTTPAPAAAAATSVALPDRVPTKSVDKSPSPPPPASAPAAKQRADASTDLPTTETSTTIPVAESTSSTAVQADPVSNTMSVAERRMIADLEANLPKWEGPREVVAGDRQIAGIPGSGWLGEGSQEYAQSSGKISSPNKVKAIMRALAGYVGPDSRRPAEVLEQIPTVVDIPNLSFTAPISFSSIQMNAQSSRYRTLRDFDLDMTRFFEKARRWSQSQSVTYGAVLVLQRLYNALTASQPLLLPASGTPEPSSIGFASIPAGPGNARFAHEAQEAKPGDEASGRHVTSFRIGTKDRIFTTEARYKGLAYKVGDYVHLVNPDDPSRPIVGQIFKTFVPTRGVRSHHITVCWYFRPEETVHPAEKQFFENEIFKTGHFCDHPVEDIIERVSVAFYVKYVRGRPKAPEYYPGWPIYVCHSRYNDQKYQMVRIKNWASCIPDELRQTDFMSIVPFPQQLDPQRIASPFLRGISGPGFLGEPKEAAGDDDEEEDDSEPRRIAKLPARGPTPTVPTLSKPQSVAHQPTTPASAAQPAESTVQNQSAYASLMYKPRPPNTSLPTYKSIVSALGGPQIADHVATREALPVETSQLFERDARGQTLWFSGPPLPLGAVPLPEPPSHSLEYLEYLCKRKLDPTSAANPQASRKSFRHHADPDTTESNISLGTSILSETSSQWWAAGQTPEQIAASMKSLIDSI